MTTPPPPARPPIPFWQVLILALTLVMLDQVVKTWTLQNISLGAPFKPFIPGLLDLTLTFNTGAAWSLFMGSAKILAAGRLLVGLGILAYLLFRPQDRFHSIIFGMISAGALGNAIDGLTQTQGVTDMFHSPALSAVTKLINGTSFPIFNVADSCVVVGTLLWFVSSLLPRKKQRPAVLATSERVDG